MQEAKEGLPPINKNFLEHGLLKPCQYPCKTPIVPVVKPTGEYRMVRDLQLINKAMVPIRPLIADPYTILSRISEDSNGLKGCLFTIPLHQDSQYLSAFEWEDSFTGGKNQCMWIVLPQGLR
jgi:hypothetical protein